MGSLGSLENQAKKLVKLGILEWSEISVPELELRTRELTLARQENSLLVVNIPVSSLVRCARKNGQAMVSLKISDADMFLPISTDHPKESVYAIDSPVLDGSLVGLSPEDALRQIENLKMEPLTLTETVLWAIQNDKALESCEGCVALGSRMTQKDGLLDPRVPNVRCVRESNENMEISYSWSTKADTAMAYPTTRGRYTSPTQ